MESWADRIRNAEQAAAEARARAADYDRLRGELTQATALLDARSGAAAAPLAARDQARAAAAEAEMNWSLARVQVENSRNDLARAQAALDAIANRATNPRRGRGAANAEAAEGVAVAEAGDRVEQIKQQVERAEQTLREAEEVAGHAEQDFRIRQQALQEAEQAAIRLEQEIAVARQAVVALEAQKTPAGAAAWEAVRAAAAAQRALGRGPLPGVRQTPRTVPAYLRITATTARLEATVERALEALERSDERFQPATALGPLLDLINRFALAGAMQKVVERLNRLKLSATRRRVLALSGYHSVLTALRAIEEEYRGLPAAELRRALRERVDDLVGLANTILLDQEETMQRALADRVVADVQRARRLNIPDAGSVREHVVNRVTARL